MADVTSIYGNPIKDAVARQDIATNTADISDLKSALTQSVSSFEGAIPLIVGYAYNTNNGELISSGSHSATGKIAINADCSFFSNLPFAFSWFVYWDDSSYLGYANSYNPSLYPTAKYVGAYGTTTKLNSAIYYRSESEWNALQNVGALGIVKVGSITANGYGNYALALTGGTPYLVDVTNYSGASGGVQLAAYKTGYASHNLPIIYDNTKILWTPDKNYDGFYTALCTVTVYAIADTSIMHLLDKAEYTVGSTNCDFTSFTEALKFAYNKGNCTLKLSPEVFDITSETDISTEDEGLLIGNGVHIIGKKGTIIRCNYTGGVGEVQQRFSVLTAQPSDFIIENVRIEATNVRYCVHDECGNTTTPYTHKYINCEMYHDSSEALWRTPQCIGGGFGTNGLCIVEGGIYECEPCNYSTTNDIGGPYSQYPLNCPISWHQNTANTSAKNDLIIKNAYLVGEGSHIKYGTGLNGNVVICGNSYGIEPQSYYPSNLYKWQNEARD